MISFSVIFPHRKWLITLLHRFNFLSYLINYQTQTATVYFIDFKIDIIRFRYFSSLWIITALKPLPPLCTLFPWLLIYTLENIIGMDPLPSIRRRKKLDSCGAQIAMIWLNHISWCPTYAGALSMIKREKFN